MKVAWTDWFSWERRGTAERGPDVTQRDIDGILEYYNARMTSPAAAEVALKHQYPETIPAAETPAKPVNDEKPAKRAEAAYRAGLELSRQGVRAVVTAVEPEVPTQEDGREPELSGEDEARQHVKEVYEKTGQRP